jgi:hypothetical protein
MSLLLLNYSHPLGAADLAMVAAACGAMPEILDLAVTVDRARPLGDVARDLADAAGLSAEEWQTRPLLLNPPALAPVALALIAELHGRRGGFPAMLNVRPVEGSTPTRYELAEVLNLQNIRDAARDRR